MQRRGRKGHTDTEAGRILIWVQHSHHSSPRLSPTLGPLTCSGPELPGGGNLPAHNKGADRGKKIGQDVGRKGGTQAGPGWHEALPAGHNSQASLAASRDPFWNFPEGSYSQQEAACTTVCYSEEVYFVSLWPHLLPQSCSETFRNHRERLGPAQVYLMLTCPHEMTKQSKVWVRYRDPIIPTKANSINKKAIAFSTRH